MSKNLLSLREKSNKFLSLRLVARKTKKKYAKRKVSNFKRVSIKSRIISTSLEKERRLIEILLFLSVFKSSIFQGS